MDDTKKWHEICKITSKLDTTSKKSGGLKTTSAISPQILRRTLYKMDRQAMDRNRLESMEGQSSCSSSIFGFCPI